MEQGVIPNTVWSDRGFPVVSRYKKAAETKEVMHDANKELDTENKLWQTDRMTLERDDRVQEHIFYPPSCHVKQKEGRPYII